MKIDARSIPAAGNFRPQPTLHPSEDGHTLAVITNWGNASATNIVVEKVRSTLSPVITDADETRVVSSGSIQREAPMESKLAEAVRAANRDILKAENSSAWTTVVEVLLVHVQGGVVFWAQAGLPHLLLQSSRGFESLSVGPESALPMMGIGLDDFPNITSGSVALAEGERLVLMSAPGSLASVVAQGGAQGLDEILSVVHAPAWVGVVNEA